MNSEEIAQCWPSWFLPGESKGLNCLLQYKWIGPSVCLSYIPQYLPVRPLMSFFVCVEKTLSVNAMFPLLIRSTRSNLIKQLGTGLARLVWVIESDREGFPWSASLGLPTWIFSTCQKQVRSSSQAHHEALEEPLCICRVEYRVDPEAFV